MSLKGKLAKGGRHRLAALDALMSLLVVDCARQVGEMQGRGWDGKEAADAYRDWLHDFADAAVDEFVSEHLRT